MQGYVASAVTHTDFAQIRKPFRVRGFGLVLDFLVKTKIKSTQTEVCAAKTAVER
jgi:hypothetical protein